MACGELIVTAMVEVGRSVVIKMISLLSYAMCGLFMIGSYFSGYHAGYKEAERHQALIQIEHKFRRPD